MKFKKIITTMAVAATILTNSAIVASAENLSVSTGANAIHEYQIGDIHGGYVDLDNVMSVKSKSAGTKGLIVDDDTIFNVVNVGGGTWKYISNYNGKVYSAYYNNYLEHKASVQGIVFRTTSWMQASVPAIAQVGRAPSGNKAYFDYKTN